LVYHQTAQPAVEQAVVTRTQGGEVNHGLIEVKESTSIAVVVFLEKIR